MWAQLITMHLKPGQEHEFAGLHDQMRALEQPGSGLLRTVSMQDQNDPSKAYVLVVFASEEAARAREADPRRQEGLQAAQARMAAMFSAPPEFVDLTVLADDTP